MNDYKIEIKIKNGLLAKCMQEKGYETAAQLSRDSKITQTDIGRFLSLKTSIYCKKTGSIKDNVKKLANFLGKSVAELFPESILMDNLKEKNKYDVYVSDENLQSFLQHTQENPFLTLESSVDKELIKKSISKILCTLTAREERVIRMLYGIGTEEKMLEDVAKDIGVSRERVRQIENKAIRKMTHPSRKKELLGSEFVNSNRKSIKDATLSDVFNKRK